MTTDEMEEIKREFLDVLLEACDGWVYPDKYTLSDNINPQVWDWIESKLKAKDTALEKQRELTEKILEDWAQEYAEDRSFYEEMDRANIPNLKKKVLEELKQNYLTPQKDEKKKVD